MKQLVLLRGCPGSGKSTFVRENGLEPYTLSPDILRLQYSAPEYNEQGKQVITQKNDGKVWKLLFEILEERMKNGDFVIVDATHSTAKLINKYKQLRADYGYRTFVVDFDVPLETCLERNKQRDTYKFVPEEVIENIHERLKHENIPSFAKVLKPEELLDEINWYKQDFNYFNEIKVIGDVHGCYTALNKFMTYEEVADNQDTAYIFVGDLFDRGLENAKVFEFIESIYKLPNVFIVEGNHERHLRSYIKYYRDIIDNLKEPMDVNDYETRKVLNKYFESNGFVTTTLKEFVENDITVDRVKPLVRKLLQCLYFEFDGADYLVTHGGILPEMLDKLNFVSTYQLINGVGGYEFDVDSCWCEASGATQIHGHRNLFREPLTAEFSINLEGRVEKGGHLRAVTIRKLENVERFQFLEHEIKNNVFDPKWLLNNKHTEKLDEDMTEKQFIELAEKESKKYIKVVSQYDDIYSINFTSKIFKEKKWNQLAVHARGLFMKKDGDKSKVVGRSYNKFFNLDEMKETKLANLVDTLQFPLTAYRKENGFLGILYYDDVRDELIYSSKSKTYLSRYDKDYANYFKSILKFSLSDEKLNFLKEQLKEHNASAVFEVIDTINDPHIVEYDASKIVLLDVVKNQLTFERVSDTYSDELSKFIGIEHKLKELVFNNWHDFYEWYKCAVDSLDFEHEGWVLEDASGFMFKMKTRWYKDWKYIRQFIDKNRRNTKYPKQFILQSHPELRDFYYWLKSKNIESYTDKDLVILRRKFKKEKVD